MARVSREPRICFLCGSLYTYQKWDLYIHVYIYIPLFGHVKKIDNIILLYQHT